MSSQWDAPLLYYRCTIGKTDVEIQYFDGFK